MVDYQQYLKDVSLDAYPMLSTYAKPLRGTRRMPVGRELELQAIEANLSRVEMNNVALLGPAGIGKSHLMEGYAARQIDRGVIVLEIDLPSMSGDGDNKFAERISTLAEEVLQFADDRVKEGLYGDVIVFLDEMHLLTMHGNSGEGGGSAAGNAIKPLMARGVIKLVGATTDEEFDRYIRPDQALTRRFQQIQVSEPDFKTTVTILHNMATTYLGENRDKIVDPEVYAEIVDYTTRFQPALAQPAKSIDILDAALGYYNARRYKINHELIKLIFKQKLSVDVDWHTDIETAMKTIRSRVRGQDVALQLVENRLYTANAGLQDPGRPMANFLFAGSTGVGKTELAKAMAEAMFGSEDKMIRFDMSEYSRPDEVTDFQNRLAAAITKTPYAVVLLDEFEKAARPITHLMLGVLDDGRLTDRYGRLVTFTNAIMVLTTNGAAESFRDIQQQGMDIYEAENHVREELGNSVFSPEFLGRFDEVIPFAPLDEDGFLMIAKIQLRKQVERVKNLHNINLEFAPEVATYLVHERFAALDDTSAGGGRAMGRRIEREIVPLIARAIDYARVDHYTIRDMRVIQHGELAALSKDLVFSDSELGVVFITEDLVKGTLLPGMKRPEYRVLT